MTTVESFLEHHGVKGMKWGIRRDGKRGSSQGPAAKPEHTDIETVKKKISSGGVSSLTNKELQDFNNRVQLEQNFARLMREANPPKGVKVFIKNTAKEVAQNQVKALANDIATDQRKKFLEKQLGIKAGGKKKDK